MSNFCPNCGHRLNDDVTLSPSQVKTSAGRPVTSQEALPKMEEVLSIEELTTTLDEAIENKEYTDPQVKRIGVELIKRIERMLGPRKNPDPSVSNEDVQALNALKERIGADLFNIDPSSTWPGGYVPARPPVTHTVTD